MQHSFDIEIATKYGLAEAILLNNICFWITKNKANDRNFHDGRYWTYNSVRAFGELFPYLSPRKIKNALNHLIDEDILMTGNFNAVAYDRTLWYALTDKGLSICRNELMDDAKKENGKGKKGQPIPDKNTDNKPDENTDNINGARKFKKPTIDEIREYCLERQNNIDPELFFDYYESNGWMVGKTHMKDWKATVRNWERKAKQRPASKPSRRQELEDAYRMSDEWARSDGATAFM